MGKNKKLKPGQTVVHKSLDDEGTGSAKKGVVQEVVGDSQLVIAKYNDEQGLLAFDKRELMGIPKSRTSQGPIVTHPRHLFSLLKKYALIRIVFLLTLIASMSMIVIYVFTNAHTVLFLGWLSILLLFLLFVVGSIFDKKISENKLEADSTADDK